MSRRCVVAAPAALVLCLVAGTAFADPYDPPANYYNAATGTGTTLKANLRTLLGVGFLSRSYGDSRFALPVIDRDPNNANNVILVYNAQSVPGTWDAGITWNREHTWPQSYGNTATSAPQYSDLHMLRPCNPSINSSRGNDPYGEGSPSTFWDPTMAGSTIQYRGEMARAMFYAATRYGDASGSITTGNFLLTDSGWGTGISKMGKLSDLLKWHFENPVDDRERLRNQRVYSQALNPTYYQNNRNAYVDRPEFVWAIWGTQPNNSTLYVGGSAASDGSSSQNVVFGPVITGAPAFGTQNVTLNKSGFTPTTYDVTVTGAATSSFSGPRKAFAYNPQFRTLAVGVTTSGVGSYSGTITVDNTDLTTQGPGFGAADANDTINVTGTILDHASPSLAAGSAVLNQTIDFGTVSRNTGTYTLSANVYNRAVTFPPSLTCGLDADSIGVAATPLSSTSVISTTLAPTLNIAAGSSLSGQVAFDSTQAAGTYQVVYTIATSDQDLPGAIARPSLTLTVLGTIQASCPGDLNGDTLVDDSDFVIFAEAYQILDCADPAMPAGCPSDLNADLIVDDSDFVLFAAAYEALLCP
ncbi:MAG: endonuclease [Phycisphaerales bacterium]|nr:endonuclease [Phycisphaerales bacterium]